MQAFHSFWSKPNYVRNNGEIDFPDFEIMTSILSALKWQQHSGEIRMITDERGAAYFTQLGLDSLWNEIDTSLEKIGPEVDPILFWAAGKLFALQTMELPCVMLDTDLIIWKDPEAEDPDLYQRDIVTAHYEELNPMVYPDPWKFKLRPGYRYPIEWDFTVKAANTAFLYLKDPGFRDRYVAQANAFFKNVILEDLNPVTAMCFAEQRVLPMCARAEKKEMGYLLDLRDLNGQEIATHTWGFKNALRESPETRRAFCVQCAKRILEEFPERESLLWGRADLREYYRQAARKC